MEQFLLFATEQWLLLVLLGFLLAALAGYEMRGGGVAISPTELTQLVNRDSALLLDLRSESVFSQGYIASARNIPYTVLESKVDTLRRWQDKAVIVVCGNGMQSSAAARSLRSHGFTKVMRLRGGVDAWQRENLPLLS